MYESKIYHRQATSEKVENVIPPIALYCTIYVYIEYI